MGIFEKGTESYKGQVITTTTHYWLDGMLEERAILWNPEKHETFSIQVGYYGIDGCNLCGMSATVDLNTENYKDMLATFKKDAEIAFEEYLESRQNEIRKDRTAEVVKGKKVPKGTVLKVFWCGERPTYRSLSHSWMHETETIAGCFNENGEKVWIKADYLKTIDILPDLTEEEKKTWFENYLTKRFSNFDLIYKEI